jgi:hypothetical protein
MTSVTDSSDISRDLTILGFAIVLVINVRGRSDAAGLLGQTAKWSVRQVAPIVAFDALGTPAVSQVLHQLLLGFLISSLPSSCWPWLRAIPCSRRA